jgi:hypothetical protein
MEEEEDEPTISTRNPTENSELLQSPDDLDDMMISHAELEELWINVKTSHSQTLAHEHDQKKDIPIKELVPEEYHEWLDVFNEKASDRFPDSRPWDHAIDTKEGFEPKNFKAYALSPEEHKLQKNSWTKISRKDISDRRNHQWPLHFSSSQRRKKTKSDPPKTTGT